MWCVLVCSSWFIGGLLIRFMSLFLLKIDIFPLFYSLAGINSKFDQVLAHLFP